MRLLHFSDLHIGVENYGRPATEADLEALPFYFVQGGERRGYLGMSTRLLDFLSTFDEVIDVAVGQRVDLVLFAGDAYKSRDPSQTHQREFARRIAYLTAQGIPVFLVVGNHDLPHSLGRATAMDIFPILSVPQVQVGDRLATYRVETRSGTLQIVALPWIRRGAFLSREEHRGKSPEELTRYVEQELTRRLLAEVERLNPDLPVLLAGHITVAGAVASTEQSMMLGRDHVLQRSDVALPAFDYVALGHMHRHQRLAEAPPVVYSGSLQRVDFGEEEDVKGFCLVELDITKSRGSRARWEFVPVHARPFVTIEAEVHSEDQDPTTTVLHAIARKFIGEAVARLHIKGPERVVAQINERAVRDALSTAHAVAPIVKEVTRERRPRLGVPASGLSPREALRRYLESKEGLSPELQRHAYEVATELLRQEGESE